MQQSDIEKTELERTAFHEAGHFVARHYLMPDEVSLGVSIVPDEQKGTLGHHTNLYGPEGIVVQSVDRAGPLEEYDAEDIKSYVVAVYAGAAAELRFDPSRSEEVRGGAMSDDEIAADWLGWLEDTVTEMEYRERARVFVEQHWREIEAIAAELLAQKTLDGVVASCIIDLVSGDADQKSSALSGLVLNLGPDKAKEILVRRVGPREATRIAQAAFPG